MKFELYGQKWEMDYGLYDDNNKYLYYDDIINLLHPNVTWFFERDDDYQGEFFVCGYDNQKKWYFIQGSFGSCSGCDWLESVETEEEAINFLTHFKNEVIVKDTKEEIIKYMQDTVLNTSWSSSTLERLINKIKDVTI